MTVQTYRIALTPTDYQMPAQVYTHVCKTHLARCTVETWHYDEAAALREADWQERKGARAEVQPCK